MPIITTSNTKDRFTYKLYSVNEIKRAWHTYGGLNEKDIEGDKRFVVCRADSETEALVLSALIIRETNLTPSATYYDHTLKKLYICCEYQHNVEDTVDGCGLVIKVFMGVPKLGDIDRCWRGEPLFYKPGTGVPPSKVQQDYEQDYSKVGKIHARIPSEFAGII